MAIVAVTSLDGVLRVNRRPVLVVDSDAEFRARVGTTLSARGFVVRLASCAKDARPIVDATSPSVIVIDEELPDARGLTWIAGLRRDGVGSPLVLLVRAESTHMPESPGSSVVVLKKPIHDDRLAETLEALLERFKPQAPKRTVSSLRDRFATSLPERLAEVGRALAHARHEATDEVIAEATLLAHRLRGTAGAFGFFEVGECAGRIEDALANAARSTDGTREAAWHTIDLAHADAIRAIAREEEERARQLGRATVETPHALHVATPASVPVPAVGPSLTKVLLVDDDPVFREYIEALGRKKLISVLSAANGAEALAIARQTPPDIALIDVRLGPEEGSFRLAQSLREIPSCERMPLAFISAAVDFESRVLATRAGASLYLTKPIDGATFDSAIQQMILESAPPSRNVVIVDSDRAFTSALALALGKDGWRASIVDRPGEILDALDAHKPDLLLLDHMAPPSVGLDVCRVLRATLRWQDLPIVLLTAETSPELHATAIAAGADDYLLKPSTLLEIEARLAQRIDRARLARDRAGRDALTGLYLRRAFLELFVVRLSEAERHHRPLGVAMLDLDHFKKINDTYGHNAGDQVLLTLGKLLSNRFRAEDLRGRWGGEEFIVAFPGESAEAIEPLFARVLAEFGRIPFYTEKQERFFATFSAGIATFSEDGSEIDALLRAADRRLYAAKRRGRNRVIARDA